jgi:hypothetical protein
VKRITVETAVRKEATVDPILDSYSDSLVNCPTIESAPSKEEILDAILYSCSDGSGK